VEIEVLNGFLKLMVLRVCNMNDKWVIKFVKMNEWLV
jgi:hypothetical protein